MRSYPIYGVRCAKYIYANIYIYTQHNTHATDGDVVAVAALARPRFAQCWISFVCARPLSVCVFAHLWLDEIVCADDDDDDDTMMTNGFGMTRAFLITIKRERVTNRVAPFVTHENRATTRRRRANRINIHSHFSLRAFRTQTPTHTHTHAYRSR